MSTTNTEDVESPSEFLEDSQITILRVVRTFAAFFSVLGSSLIIWHAVRQQKTNPKNRLLIGLSLADLIFSLENVIFTPLLYPLTEPSPLCNFDAWIHLLGNAAAYYNATLSVYFLAVIRWNVRDRQFATRYEPFCHFFPIAAAVTAATTGLVLDLYNPKAEGLGCWVEDYPRGCTDTDELEVEECRGDATTLKLFPAVAVVLPFVVALLTMIVSNAMIYGFVRHLEHRNARYMTSSDPNDTKSRQIATQSFCYIGAFFLCYLPGVVFWIFGFVYPDGQTNGQLLGLQVINALFFPAQGFFNALVYLRPQYLAWRQAGHGRLSAWRMAVIRQSVPKRRQLPVPANHTNSHTDVDKTESGTGGFMSDGGLQTTTQTDSHRIAEEPPTFVRRSVDVFGSNNRDGVVDDSCASKADDPVVLPVELELGNSIVTVGTDRQDDAEEKEAESIVECSSKPPSTRTVD